MLSKFKFYFLELPGIFFSEYFFLSAVDWILKFGTCGYRGPYYKPCCKEHPHGYISPHMLMHAKLLQSYLILCDPMDCSLPGSSVYGLPYLLPGHLPDKGIKPESLTSHAFAGRFFTTSATWEALSQRSLFFSGFCNMWSSFPLQWWDWFTLLPCSWQHLKDH